MAATAGFLDLALHRDGVELPLDAGRSADVRESVLAPELFLQERGHRRKAMTGARKLPQHGVVLEFPEHDRMHVETGLPSANAGLSMRYASVTVHQPAHLRGDERSASLCEQSPRRASRMRSCRRITAIGSVREWKET